MFDCRLMRNIGVTTGFIGCVEMLKVNSSEMSLIYDLTRASSAYVENQVNISECAYCLLPVCFVSRKCRLIFK